MTRSESLGKFRDIIMELRHNFNNPSLENQIQHLAESETESNRFLIKMEIMKLSQDVQRVIDLRSFFSVNCEKFIYQGITHFLDTASKNELEKELNRYGGNYTLGVYEHVMRKAKTRYKANPHALLNVSPKTEEIHLTTFFQRKEERLYFIKKISFFYNSPEKMTKTAFDNLAIDGITTDISSTGLAIKVAKQNVRRTKGLIHVWMHGIEAEFKFSERVLITYEIKNTFEKNGYIYFNLNYYSKQFSKGKDEFITFSKSYLEAEKKRNNIPVDNTVRAINIKISEQFIIGRLRSLPVFLIEKNGVWLPGAQFKTPNNSNIGYFANINNNNNFLRSLCIVPSIQSKMSLGERFCDYFFIMPFKDENNITNYFAIPYNSMINNESLKEKARAALQENKLKLYRIDGNKISPEEQSHVPSSLPSSAGEAFENMNQQPAERAKLFSKQLKRMIVLSDFSDSINYLNLLNDISDKQENDTNLSQYILKKPAKYIDIYEATAETNDVRTEDRFSCNMNVLIQKKAHKSDDFVPCSTLNISTRGLKIKLSKLMHLNVGDIVLVHLPELPGNGDRGARYQPYTIVGKDSDLEYRLSVVGKAADHDGRKMMRTYIHKNINSLKPGASENEIYGLSRVLRNIFANNIHLPHGITAKEGSSRYIKNIATSENAHIPALNDGSTNNIPSLMDTDAFRSPIINKIELINDKNPYETLYFIVMSRTRGNGNHYFFIKQITEAKKDAELITLMQTLRCIGEPRLLRIIYTKKSRVFNKYFRDELSYLERFAVTKVKNIESGLRNTIGVFEMADVTDLIAR